MSSNHALRSSGIVLPLITLLLNGEPASAAEVLQIGIVDFYGVGQIGADSVRQALSFKEGDSIEMRGRKSSGPR